MSKIEINFEKFLESRMKLDSCFLILFIIYLVYLISLYVEAKERYYYYDKVYKYSLNMKRNCIIVMLCYYVYGIYYTSVVGDALKSVSNEILLVLAYLIKASICAIMIFVIDEQAKKNMKNKNISFVAFWAFISFHLFAEIFNEIRFEVIFSIISFNIIGITVSFSLCYLFVVYPNDLYYENYNVENPPIPLQPLRSIKTSRKNCLKETFLKDDFTLGEGYYNETIVKTVKTSKAVTALEFTKNESAFSSTRGSQETVDDLPQIEAKVTNKVQVISNENNPFDFDSYFLTLAVSVDNPSIKRKIKRTLADFIKLETSIQDEFTEKRYPSRVINSVPVLLLTKNSSSFLEEHADTAKGLVQKYLDMLLRCHYLITDEVLMFLEIYDFGLSESFRMEREKHYRRNRIKNKSKDDNDFLEIRNNEQFYADSLFSLKQESQKQSFKLGNVREINEIRVEEMFQRQKEMELIIKFNFKDRIKFTQRKLGEVLNLFKELDVEKKLTNNLIENENKIKHYQLRLLNEIFSILVKNKQYKSPIFIEVFHDVLNDAANHNINIYNRDLGKLISKIKVEIPCYTLIQNRSFQSKVFYEVNLHLFFKNSSYEKVILPCRYKELLEYIHKLQRNKSHFVEAKKNNKCSQTDFIERTIERKRRLEDLLNKIFSTKFIFDNEVWIEIFHCNHSYQTLIQSKHSTPGSLVLDRLL